jgi:type II secretion system protein N
MATDALDTNLLRSPGKAGKGGDAKADKGPSPWTRKRIAKLAAYTVFFFWSLITFTLLKIPDSVVANFLLNSLNTSTPYQWQAEKIGLAFFPAPHLVMEKIDLQPKFPGAGIPLSIDSFSVYPNPFALIPLFGGPSAGGSFSAEAYKAALKGSFSSGRDVSVKLESDSIDLSKIAPLAGHVDIKGILSAIYVQAHLPNQRLGAADGEIQLKGKNMVFDPSGLGLPIALPILNLGDLDVNGTITKGLLKIEKFKVGGPGKDLELSIPTGTVNLSDVTPNTRYDLHLLLKFSPAIEKAVPGIGGMMGMWSSQKPDGSYAMHINGTLAAPGFPTKD